MILITIEQIKYFIALNRFKSFSITAEELCISQSSLSKYIKSLESELDTTLFNRSTRNISLTESGKEFLIHAERFLSEYESIITNMKKYSTQRKNTLTIGTIPIISQYGITALINIFKNTYPDITINIIEGERDQVIDMLNKSEVDIAFLRDINLKNDLYDLYPLIEDELVIITSKKHPFSTKKYINIEDAKNENFILLGSSSGMDKFCISQCNKHGFSPNITYRVNKIETILGLVEENFGITMLMSKVINVFNSNNISINLFKEPITNYISIVCLKDKKLSSNEILFRDFIIEYTSNRVVK